MRGGIQDYDDSSLRQWTVDHPDKDWLPLDFVTTVDKRFLFSPGRGGSYSGVSYVLMGWVLCAATGCSDWSDLRQAELIEQGSDFKFDAARFMGAGPCSQYDGLVHQWAAAPRSNPGKHSAPDWPACLRRYALPAEGGGGGGGGGGREEEAARGRHATLRSAPAEAWAPRPLAGTCSARTEWPRARRRSTRPKRSRRRAPRRAVPARHRRTVSTRAPGRTATTRRRPCVVA